MASPSTVARGSSGFRALERAYRDRIVAAGVNQLDALQRANVPAEHRIIVVRQRYTLGAVAYLAPEALEQSVGHWLRALARLPCVYKFQVLAIDARNHTVALRLLGNSLTPAAWEAFERAHPRQLSV